MNIYKITCENGKKHWRNGFGGWVDSNSGIPAMLYEEKDIQAIKKDGKDFFKGVKVSYDKV